MKDAVRLLFALSFLSLVLLSAFHSFAVDAPNESEFWIPLNPPLSQYSIEVKLDPQNNRLEGTETIRLTNTAKRPLSRLLLYFPSYDADGMQVSIGGGPVRIVARGAGLPEFQTLIELPEPLVAGASVELNVRFNNSMSSRGGVIKLADWHPRLYWGCDSVDDYEVRIDAPQDYALAVSGVYDADGKLYAAKGVRSFGVVLMKDVVVKSAQSDGVNIYCYVEEEAEECAGLILKTAVEAVDYYRDWLGFYPHEVLHIVPGGISNPAGGYPIATSIVGIHGQKKFDSAPLSHWRFITAHEIGHQYWMDCVLQAPDEFWLMIGLGVYADRSFMRAKGFGDEHERNMIQRYVSSVGEKWDTRMNRMEEETKKVGFDYNNVVTHGKGFAFISALANVMGKDAFESVYRRCLEEYAARMLNAADFQRLCERESGQRLDWFFDPWIETSRYLSYRFVSQDVAEKNGEYEISVKIENAGTMQMAVPVTAWFQDGSSQCQYTDRMLNESILVFSSKSPLKEIKVDARGELALIPPADPTVKNSIDEIKQLSWTGDGDRALRIYQKLDGAEIDDLRVLFKFAMCLYDGKHYEESLKTFESGARQGKGKNATYYFACLVWQGHVLDLTNQREKAVACYQQAIDSGYGDGMRHDQYGMRIDRAWARERLKTPFQRP